MELSVRASGAPRAGDYPSTGSWGDAGGGPFERQVRDLGLTK